jgi:flavin reductase (DIM6/NTAB) family NADH-FMN oxidoreductase RutF
LEPVEGFLDRVLSVAPLVVVGTLEQDGAPDLAPKHMVTPLGERHLAFVCSPTHATHGNLSRTGQFTVSWLPDQGVLLASLAAAPRQPDGAKPALLAVPTRPAQRVEGVVLRDAPVTAECQVERVMDDWGHWSLVVGEVVHATARPDAVLSVDEDAHDVLARSPLLAYVHPGHVATIDRADAFPYHRGFRR